MCRQLPQINFSLIKKKKTASSPQQLKPPFEEKGFSIFKTGVNVVSKYFETLALQKNLLYVGAFFQLCNIFLEVSEPTYGHTIDFYKSNFTLVSFLNNSQQNIYHLFIALLIYSATGWINIFFPQIGINECMNLVGLFDPGLFLYIYSLWPTVASPCLSFWSSLLFLYVLIRDV